MALISSLIHSPMDVRILILQRFIRLFAYGSSTLILVLLLTSLRIPDSKIGLFMTLTLWGDVVISFFLTLFADSIGRRLVLMVGALLMVGSGVTFATSGNYWVLLTAAVLGVITPAGNEIGPFRAIEESTLSHLIPASDRADIFAWYSLIGSAGAAGGTITCGWVVQKLMSEGLGDTERYRMVFWGYSIIGLVKFGLACCLSENCEASKEQAKLSANQGQVQSERAPLLGGETESQMREPPKKSWLPKISKESQGILFKLCLLFALDSFASGLAPLSWITAFFHRKFGLAEGELGSLFFTTAIISALSSLVAAKLARKIGLIQTMVFTHLPSAICLALVPIPNQLWAAMSLLILRHCTATMDSAPRSAFLAAVLLPSERTAVMGVVNVVKTSAQSLGPFLTGLLAQTGYFWVAFVAAGSLKVCYDLGMLGLFVRQKMREESEHE